MVFLNRVRNWDQNADEDFKSTYQMLEEKLSEADFRSLGGLRTEDQKFAFAMRETLKETLDFLDRMEKLIETIVTDMEHRVNEAEAERSEFETKLDEVRDYVSHQKLLQRLEEILNS